MSPSTANAVTRLPPRWANLAKRLKRRVEIKTDFFGKLAARGGDGILAGVQFAFRIDQCLFHP